MDLPAILNLIQTIRQRNAQGAAGPGAAPSGATDPAAPPASAAPSPGLNFLSGLVGGGQGGGMGGLGAGGGMGGAGGGSAGLYGAIAQIALKAVRKASDNTMDFFSSKSDNVYPHAAHIGDRARGQQVILDENQARRDQQTQLQSNSIAANQQASAEERGWRSGEADKSRTASADLQAAAQIFSGGQNAANRQNQRDLFGMQQGAYDAHDNRNYTRKLQEMDANRLNGLRGMMIELGESPYRDGPFNPGQAPIRSAQDMESIIARRNREALQQTASEKLEKLSNGRLLDKARLDDYAARKSEKEAQATWLKSQLGNQDQSGSPAWATPFMDLGVNIR